MIREDFVLFFAMVVLLVNCVVLGYFLGKPPKETPCKKEAIYVKV